MEMGLKLVGLNEITKEMSEDKRRKEEQGLIPKALRISKTGEWKRISRKLVGRISQ